MLSNTWLEGDGFSVDFTAYPEADEAMPIVDKEAILERALRDSIQ